MKIGILGGTFNPIHVGHGLLSNYITQYTDINQVWLMVSPQNPLKKGQYIESDTSRITMAAMVARKCHNVSASAFEFSLPRPSYTIDSLRLLKEKFPNDEFYLIIGSDNWKIFDKWRDPQSIIDEFHIIIYPRRGYDIDEHNLPKNVSYLNDAPMIEVSSTFIREGIANNKNMSCFLMDDVYSYILSHSLYLK